MPKQNRVTPLGEIVAVPLRGTMMGNRGVLHDERGVIKRPWQLKRWIVCVLEFRGRHREVMTPGRYTELFFLDEATALAAGHRPCFECRREAFRAFAQAWARGNHIKGEPTAGAIDERLHSERIGAGRSKRTYTAKLASLPEGVFVTGVNGSNEPHLFWQGRLHLWSPGGYKETVAASPRTQVTVLTPRSTVEAIRAGYSPGVHVSAEAR